MSESRPLSFPRARALVLGAAGLALVAGASSRVNAADEVLRVLTWEGLANDQWVKPFEEGHDVEVKRTYVGSNDEYMAKLAAGDTQYDVVVIVSSLAQPAINAGFVEPVDLGKVPNFEQLYP